MVRSSELYRVIVWAVRGDTPARLRYEPKVCRIARTFDVRFQVTIKFPHKAHRHVEQRRIVRWADRQRVARYPSIRSDSFELVGQPKCRRPGLYQWAFYKRLS